MSITSTVPGAVSVLSDYLVAAATAFPDLNADVYLGKSTGALHDNYLQVGDYEEGIILAPDTYTWAAIPGQTKRRTESYALQGCIRAWAGNTDPTSRLADAFALLNNIHDQVVSDMGGSGKLSPSGSWGDLEVTMKENGPLGASGWGVVLEFQLHVINAEIVG